MGLARILILTPLLSVTFLVNIHETFSRPYYLDYTCKNSTIALTTKYHTNLNTTLTALTSTATGNRLPWNGFFNTSAGAGTSDAVYGLFLCRFDQNASSCGDCVQTATTSALPRYCPSSKVAVIWYEECMVRYSNESISGTLAERPMTSLMSTARFDGNQTEFFGVMWSTMNGLVGEAANNSGSGKKFATKMENVTASVTLYATEQCTPDLTVDDCSRCLRKAVGWLETMNGARILMPSCDVRFETYPFYKGAVDYSLPEPELAPAPAPAPAANSTSSGKWKASTIVTVAIVIPVGVVCVIMLAVGICINIARRRSTNINSVPIDSGDDDFATIESLQYDFITLQSATNNFTEENKLGEGGFGSVYMGTLSNGQNIAVKRMSKGSCQGEQEFKNEVVFIAKLQHRNLVRLLGFCYSEKEMMLVYEYLPNKSLDYFLFDAQYQTTLEWERRYKIIKGIARGMLYLHQDSRVKIIHRDLKPSNVLLDDDMNPKISDFGMARIFGMDHSQYNTNKVVGTYGYMAPEYGMHGQFSVKSDVYSFGVIVLEIISGKKNTSFHETGYAEDLLTYAWTLWRDEKPLEFVDPILKDTCSNSEVIRCMLVGLLCVQHNTDDRPTIATAMLLLDTNSITPPIMPKEPASFLRSTSETHSFTLDQ